MKPGKSKSVKLRRKSAGKPARRGAGPVLPEAMLARFQQLFEAMPDLVYLKDAAGRMRNLNAPLQRLIARPRAEIIGKTDAELFGPELAALCRKSDETVLRTKKSLRVEEIAGQGESLRIFDTVKAPVLDDAHAVVGVLGISRDVTEIRKREAALRSATEQLANSDEERIDRLKREAHLREEAVTANRAKDEFLAVLSHELRTPMTAMMGWTWLLRSAELNSGEYHQALEAIERNMKAQAQIIEDLLDVSQIVRGKMRIRVRPTELGPLLSAAIDVTRPAAEARSIRVTQGLPERELSVSGDPERLGQAVWNLVSNAVKFTGTGGSVSAVLRDAGRHAELVVEDTGVGMNPETVARIFDPFTQAEDSMTREHGGIGLGLAITRHIAELHGGLLRAESDGLGKGSRFTLRLPLLLGEAKPESSPAEAPGGRDRLGLAPLADLSGIKVLVVENEADTRAMLRSILERCRARVSTTASAEEGFTALKRDRPDVLLADLAMPGEDGFSLIRRVRELPAEQGGATPAAAVTARTGKEDRTQVLLSGFQIYLPKPIDPAELAAVVRALSRRK